MENLVTFLQRAGKWPIFHRDRKTVSARADFSVRVESSEKVKQPRGEWPRPTAYRVVCRLWGPFVVRFDRGWAKSLVEVGDHLEFRASAIGYGKDNACHEELRFFRPNAFKPDYCARLGRIHLKEGSPGWRLP